MEMSKSESHRPSEVSNALKAGNFVELDVRPILEKGGEPFGEIMQAVAKTPADGVFRLIASFMPSPLFHVLGKQGWSNWIESGEEDRWAIWFYRSSSPKKSEAIDPARKKAEDALALLQRDEAELRKRLRSEGSTWYLDVKLLFPPEPMTLTLAVLEKLPPGFSLIQENERVPQFLLPILEERGFRYDFVKSDESVVQLRIWRA